MECQRVSVRILEAVLLRFVSLAANQFGLWWWTVVVGDFIIKENFVQCKIIRIIRDSRGWLGARSAVVVVVVLLVGQ